MATSSPVARPQYHQQPLTETPPTAPRPSMLRRWSSWAMLGLAFCLTLELACRVEDWVMYRMPLLSRFSTLNDLVVHDSTGWHGRPNAQFEKWRMNSFGIRGPETALQAAPGTFRVMTVGASETFGLRETENHEYPRQLEDSLNVVLARGQCPNAPMRRFEVLNAAFAGMGLPTIDQDLRNRLWRLHPAIIVVYANPEAYLDDDRPVAAPPDTSTQAAHRNAGHNLPLSRGLMPRAVGRVREQLKQATPGFIRTFLRVRQTRAMLAQHPKGWRFDSIPADRIAAYEADLRVALGTIRQVGAMPLLVTHGNEFMGRRDPDKEMLIAWEKFYPRATAPVIVAFDSLAREVTLRVGADSGVTTIDAARVLSAAPVSIFADFVHFTDAGSAVMADVIRPGVLHAAGLASCAPTDAPNAASRDSR